MPEPSDLDLWRCTETTLRSTVVPALDDEVARTAAQRLVGVAVHARTRPPDPTGERVAELSAVLDALAENPLVFSEWPIVSNAPAAVMTAVARVLVAAVDDAGPTGDAVRAQLRSLAVRHVDDDLAVTNRLLDYLGAPFDDRFDEHALDGIRADVALAAEAGATVARRALERCLDGYRAATDVPIPLLEEAAAWLERRLVAAAAVAADDTFWAAFHQFARACAQLGCLVELAGPCPSPDLVIVGTAVQRTSLRRLAELIN
jgi:hypothetical protein